MKLLLSELPETHDQTALWLERQVVGMELSRLVTELAAVHGGGRPAESVRGVLAGDLDGVLANGLRTLPPEKLRLLMVQPFHLFELQELVFSYGGDYWRLKESELDLRHRVEADWRRLKSALPAALQAAEPGPARLEWRRWLRNPLVLAAGFCLGVAACYLTLIGFALPNASRPAANRAWGWNKPDATAPAETPRAYLGRLGDLADEWFQVAPAADVPNRKLQLVVRLLELRSGCTRLCLIDHPLPAGQGEKLKEKANGWCKDIDGLVQHVQEANDLAPWTPAIDELVRRIAEDLRAGRLDPN